MRSAQTDRSLFEHEYRQLQAGEARWRLRQEVAALGFERKSIADDLAARYAALTRTEADRGADIAHFEATLVQREKPLRADIEASQRRTTRSVIGSQVQEGPAEAR